MSHHPGPHAPPDRHRRRPSRRLRGRRPRSRVRGLRDGHADLGGDSRHDRNRSHGSHGTTAESFDVEVLGVLENGIAPGRDMIIVDTSSPAIDAAGGIWAGISGSPVYIGGQFAGTVSYGLTFGPSSIAGLTPAEDVAALVDLPATAAIRRLDRIPGPSACRTTSRGSSPSTRGSRRRPRPASRSSGCRSRSPGSG